MKKSSNTKREHTKHQASKKGYKHIWHASKGQVNHYVILAKIFDNLDSVKISE